MKKKGITWFLQGKRTAQRITACKENRKRNKRKENIKGITEKEKYQTQSKWHKGNVHSLLTFNALPGFYVFLLFFAPFVHRKTNTNYKYLNNSQRIFCPSCVVHGTCTRYFYA